MQIDWWTLGLQTINVLVLVFILGRFLFRPVAAMIEERRNTAAKLLDEARAARAAAEAERQTAQKEAADLAQSRGEALKTAAGEAEAEKRNILASARADVDRLRAAAEEDIARERRQAEAAASDHASRLALDIAAKLVARLPDEARITGFIDGLAEAVRALPDTVKAHMGEGDAPVRLKAPRALTEAEARACRGQLSEALGRPVDVAPIIDPSLIAGLEIDMPHAAVRNSFRADLDRIGAALTREGRETP